MPSHLLLISEHHIASSPVSLRLSRMRPPAWPSSDTPPTSSRVHGVSQRQVLPCKSPYLTSSLSSEQHKPLPPEY